MDGTHVGRTRKIRDLGILCFVLRKGAPSDINKCGAGSDSQMS